MSLVADIEGNKIRLSANANVAVTMEQHWHRQAARVPRPS
jgi:hypothetical protein